MKFPCVLLSSCLALLAGCASPPPAADDGAACEAWFERADRAVTSAGVNDAQYHQVAGFPYLRVDRLLASFATEAEKRDVLFEEWLGALDALDRDARAVEFANLPQAALPGGVGDWRARRDTCAATLIARDRSRPSFRATLRAAANVPDDYSATRRALGLYPLVAIPFFAGVKSWESATGAAFAWERDRLFDASIHRRYLPPHAMADAPSVGAWNALGIPRLTSDAQARLLAAHAPVWEVETASNDDRIGEARIAQGRAHIEVAAATVYGRVAFTRFEGRVLPQLVYTAWFPRRPAAGAFDLLAGEFDGLILRLTLDEDGAVLLADSIHACGCYHQFFPSARLRARAGAANEEWAFSPAPLPALADGERLTFRIAARTHYLTRVATMRVGETSDVDGVRYRLLDENELRSLADTDGSRKSFYGPGGLVAGSERGERFLFWPMGINSAGAMRQWGRHATAFVGRRHFDDADLIERRFSRVPDMRGETKE